MTDQPAAGARNPFVAAAPAAPVAPPSEGHGIQPTENPRSRGHSPARDAREAAPEPTERSVKVGDDSFPEQTVREALRERSEREIIKRSLPGSPDKYEIKLPENFESPVGVNFEFDANDPILRDARELAHRRGMDQAQFSEFLGLYAANRISESVQAEAMRQRHLRSLGSRATQRLDGIATFLIAQAGKEGQALAEFIQRYPNQTFVSALERIIHTHSAQGSAEFTQSGRTHEAPKPHIPQYAGGSQGYAAVRAAQDSARRHTEGRR